MVPVDTARDLVLAQTAPLPAEPCPQATALGRVLAVDVHARRQHPPADNSAMGELSAAVLSPLARLLADGIEARCDRLSDRVQPLPGRHAAVARPALEAVHATDLSNLIAVLERLQPLASARALRDFDTPDELAPLVAQLAAAERNPT